MSCRRSQAEALFNRLDADGNNSLKKREIVDGLCQDLGLERPDALNVCNEILEGDKNDDDVITRDEFWAAIQKLGD